MSLHFFDPPHIIHYMNTPIKSQPQTMPYITPKRNATFKNKKVAFLLENSVFLISNLSAQTLRTIRYFETWIVFG